MATTTSLFTKIALVLVTSIGSAATAYVKARTLAKYEADAGYVAVRAAIEAQRQDMIQFRSDEEQWHRMVADIVADRRMTVVASHAQPILRPLPLSTLERLRRPSPALKAIQLPSNLSQIQMAK